MPAGLARLDQGAKRHPTLYGNNRYPVREIKEVDLYAP
jgi:hypothetical protein